MAKKIERTYIGSFDDAVEFWAPDGNYIHNISGFSQWIVTNTRKIFVRDYREDDPFVATGKGYLGVLSRTKAHIRKRLKDGLIDEVKSSGVQYGRAKDITGDVVCVDVRSAYITAALHIGALSDGMYRMLRGCSKKTRLAAIGTLASKRNVITYVNGERVDFAVVEDLELTVVYKRIIDRLNLDVRAVSTSIGNDFIAYWVDNFYCIRGSEIKSQDYFRQLGYETKITEGMSCGMKSALNAVAEYPCSITSATPARPATIAI